MAFLVLRGISKSLILIFFWIIFLAFSFWIILTPKISEANGCRTSCNHVAGWDAAGIVNCGGNSGCFYSDVSHIDPGSDDGACSVAGTGLRLCNPINFYNPSCNNANMQCKESNCSGLTGTTGSSCVVTLGHSTVTNLGTVCVGADTKNGTWDNTRKQCIECPANSNNKGYVWGNSTSVAYTTPTLIFKERCGADASCDGQVAGYACESGKKCDADGKCVATATCNSNPTVTVSPTSKNTTAGTSETYTVDVKNNDQSGCANSTFNLTLSGCPSGWPTCDILSPSPTSLTISPGGNKNTTLTIKSPSGAISGNNAVVTVTATGGASNSGSATATYTVENCPANFSASFTKNCYANIKSENFAVNYKVAPNSYGCVAIYRSPYSGSSDDRANDTLDNTGHSVPKTGTWNTTLHENSPTGVWRVTLNAGTICKYNDGCMGTAERWECCGNTDCSAPQTCNSATHTCSAASACTAPSCNGATQYCSGGSWVNCPGGQTCSAGVCSGGGISAPLCQSALIASDIGKLCGVSYTVNAVDVGSWCCSAANGVALNQTICQAMDPACAGSSGAEICTGGADEDGDGDIDCADSDCAADPACVAPPAASCSGPNMYTSPLMFGYCTIPEIIAAAINWILGLVSAIIILILIFGGITYVISAGDEERIKTAKNTILYAIIGLAIILLAYTMVNEVKDILKIVP